VLSQPPLVPAPELTPDPQASGNNATDPATKATARARARGFNLLVTTVLFFGGIAFGAVAFSPVENDLTDRFDDLALAAVGVIAVVWYLAQGHRGVRSVVPLVLAGASAVIQLIAIPLERDDASAFGDNIGGIIFFVGFAVFAIYQARKAPPPVVAPD
jgi:dolichol kinase